MTLITKHIYKYNSNSPLNKKKTIDKTNNTKKVGSEKVEKTAFFYNSFQFIQT